jgi:hypothetical protein
MYLPCSLTLSLVSFVSSLIDTFRAYLSHTPYVFPRLLSINSILSFQYTLYLSLGPSLTDSSSVSQSLLFITTTRPSTLVYTNFSVVDLPCSVFFCSLGPFLNLAFFYLLSVTIFNLARNQCCGSVNISFGSESAEPNLTYRSRSRTPINYRSGRIRILPGHFCTQ